MIAVNGGIIKIMESGFNMLKIDIENNINSIPYLLYMQEQEQKVKDKDSGNEKLKAIWRADRPPLAHNQD